MARSRSKKNTNYSRTRVANTNANRRLRFGTLDLTDFEDNRTYHPEGDYRDRRDLFGGPARSKVLHNQRRSSKPTRNSLPKFGAAVRVFEVPQDAVTCVRRSQRREVIFAKKKAGRGGQKKAKWTMSSKIKCRR